MVIYFKELFDELIFKNITIGLNIREQKMYAKLHEWYEQDLF